MSRVQVFGIHCCWVCGNVCTLEECKIDECGLPVHEDCYVARLMLNQAADRNPTVGAELGLLHITLFSVQHALEQGLTDNNTAAKYAAFVLRSAYHEHGYWGAKVETRQAGTVWVFAVDPGPVYVIHDVKFYGLKTFPIANIMAGAPKPGDIYSLAQVSGWMAATREKYVGRSRPLKDVSWGTRLNHALAQATIEVTVQRRSLTASPR